VIRALSPRRVEAVVQLERSTKVLAALTAGLTFAQVEEFFGIIGIQFMSRKIWFELEEELTPAIDELLEEVLAENNAIEYALCAPNPD
jgi:hypothetical protein